MLNHMSSGSSVPNLPTSSTNSIRNNAAGDLMSGKAFDNGCICQLESHVDMVNSILRGGQRTCQCCAPQLQPEMEFVNALMNIGIKLGTLETKEQKSKI